MGWDFSRVRVPELTPEEVNRYREEFHFFFLCCDCPGSFNTVDEDYDSCVQDGHTLIPIGVDFDKWTALWIQQQRREYTT